MRPKKLKKELWRITMFKSISENNIFNRLTKDTKHVKDEHVKDKELLFSSNPQFISIESRATLETNLQHKSIIHDHIIRGHCHYAWRC